MSKLCPVTVYLILPSGKPWPTYSKALSTLPPKLADIDFLVSYDTDLEKIVEEANPADVVVVADPDILANKAHVRRLIAPLFLDTAIDMVVPAPMNCDWTASRLTFRLASDLIHRVSPQIPRVFPLVPIVAVRVKLLKEIPRVHWVWGAIRGNLVEAIYSFAILKKRKLHVTIADV